MINAVNTQPTFKNFTAAMPSKEGLKYSAPLKQTQNVDEKQNKKTNLLIAGASLAGALIPLFLIRKHQGVKIDKEKFFTNLTDKLSEIAKDKSLSKGGTFKEGSKAVFENLKNKVSAIHKSFNDTELEAKEMIMMSLGSLSAGFGAGMISDKEKTPQKTKARVKDFVFQAFNVALPTMLTGAMIGFVEKNPAKFKKQGISKFLSIVLGVGAGMPLATVISNKVNKVIDPSDKGKKIQPKNYLVHADDAVAALALAKVPFVESLPVKEVLPLIFANCGYETGTGEE